MRRFPLFLAVSLSLFAQQPAASLLHQTQTGKPEITFIEQRSSLAGIDEYEVAVCNRSGFPLSVDPVDVRVYAFQAGIAAASHSSVVSAIDKVNRRSVAYYGALATEIGTWATTIVISLDRTDNRGVQTGPIKINSRVKALLPTGAAFLSFARYLIDRERRVAALPDNLLPVLPFSLPAGLCQSYAFYGVAK